ncbi:MAG: hypothetical protein ACKOC5_09610, partial [Chloroflexota bacterium]
SNFSAGRFFILAVVCFFLSIASSAIEQAVDPSTRAGAMLLGLSISVFAWGFVIFLIAGILKLVTSRKKR